MSDNGLNRMNRRFAAVLANVREVVQPALIKSAEEIATPIDASDTTSRASAARRAAASTSPARSSSPPTSISRMNGSWRASAAA